MMNDGKGIQGPQDLVSAWYTAYEMPEVSVNIGDFISKWLEAFRTSSPLHTYGVIGLFSRSQSGFWCHVTSVKEMWLLESHSIYSCTSKLSLTRRYVNSLCARLEPSDLLCQKPFLSWRSRWWSWVRWQLHNHSPFCSQAGLYSES